MQKLVKKWWFYLLLPGMIIIGGEAAKLLAQPGLPSDPARPISWGHSYIIAICCMGYGTVKIWLSRHK